MSVFTRVLLTFVFYPGKMSIPTEHTTVMEHALLNFGDGYTAFEDHNLMIRGTLEDVVKALREKTDEGSDGRVAVFENKTGRALDFDLRGTVDEVLARLANHPVVGTHTDKSKPRKGPGRPKLGVVSREVTLLPRHWEWLGAQPGGASGALRRLVEAARKSDTPHEKAKRARDATYGFLSDIAGNLPGFEEAARALFAGDHAAFLDRISEWPADIRRHAQLTLDEATGE